MYIDPLVWEMLGMKGVIAFLLTPLIVTIIAAAVILPLDAWPWVLGAVAAIAGVITWEMRRFNSWYFAPNDMPQ